MNPISSSDFRNNNQVVFKSKILKECGWTVTANCGASTYRIGSADVIDLNHNDKPDATYQSTGFTTFKKTMTEPNLANKFSQLEEYGKRYGAEVLTQDDMRDIQVENTSWSGGTTVFTKDTITKENQRPISSLVNELEPFEKDAKWAIDLKSQEFLIYTPKQK